jgi:hypothetical protein
MIIAKSYFEIPPNLVKILFTKVNDAGQLELNFNSGNTGELYSLNYYNFNILLHQTKDQNTVYHGLTDDFFNELSLHKNKMVFYGYLDLTAKSFTPTHIIYDHPHKKMGILVKKKIVKRFGDYNIDLIIPKKQRSELVTRFLIV